MVEQRTFNPLAAGSSPAGPTTDQVRLFMDLKPLIFSDVKLIDDSEDLKCTEEQNKKIQELFDYLVMAEVMEESVSEKIPDNYTIVMAGYEIPGVEKEDILLSATSLIWK